MGFTIQAVCAVLGTNVPAVSVRRFNSAAMRLYSRGSSFILLLICVKENDAILWEKQVGCTQYSATTYWDLVDDSGKPNPIARGKQ